MTRLSVPRQTWLSVGLLLLISGSVFFVNLGTPKLWDRDEPRNAGCAREMLERGDWVTPIFNGELREQKPVMLYWLIMSAYLVLGESEFAARFWSAALASGTVLWTFAIGRRLLGSQAGLWAGIVLSTSLMFGVAARAATPDSVLIFFGTTAIGLWVLGTFAPAGDQVRTWGAPGLRVEGQWFPHDRRWAIAVYAAMGLGVLAKGPVGFVIPVAIIGMFNLLARLKETAGEGDSRGFIVGLSRRLAAPFHPMHFLKTTWSMRPLLAALVVLLVAGPWYVLVGIQTDGDFLKEFFLKEHFGRATTAMENHSGGWWFYPLALLMGTFPWSIFAIPVVLCVDRTLSTRRSDQPLGLVLGLAWLGVYLTVFTIAKTKLPSYITPCYPGVALLVGDFLARVVSGKAMAYRRLWRVGLAIMGLVGVLMSVGVGLAAHEFLPGAEWLAVIGLVPLTGALVADWFVRRNQTMRMVVSVSATATILATFLFGGVAVVADRYQQSAELLDKIESDEAIIATYGSLESSWVFYAHDSIYELVAGEQREPVDLQARSAWQDKPRMTLSQFLDQSGAHYIVTTNERFAEVAAGLPDSFHVIDQVPYFMNDEQLILIGPKSVERTARVSPEFTLR